MKSFFVFLYLIMICSCYGSTLELKSEVSAFVYLDGLCVGKFPNRIYHQNVGQIRLNVSIYRDIGAGYHTVKFVSLSDGRVKRKRFYVGSNKNMYYYLNYDGKKVNYIFGGRGVRRIYLPTWSAPWYYSIERPKKAYLGRRRIHSNKKVPRNKRNHKRRYRKQKYNKQKKR